MPKMRNPALAHGAPGSLEARQAQSRGSTRRGHDPQAAATIRARARMTTLAAVAPKLVKLVSRLASTHQGEVIATVHALGKTLGGAGLDFNDLAAAIEPKASLTYTSPLAGHDEPEIWLELTRWCRDQHGQLADHERKFVWDMCGRLVCGGEPTERQGAW